MFILHCKGYVVDLSSYYLHTNTQNHKQLHSTFVKILSNFLSHSLSLLCCYINNWWLDIKIVSCSITTFCVQCTFILELNSIPEQYQFILFKHHHFPNSYPVIPWNNKKKVESTNIIFQSPICCFGKNWMFWKIKKKALSCYRKFVHFFRPFSPPQNEIDFNILWLVSHTQTNNSLQTWWVGWMLQLRASKQQQLVQLLVLFGIRKNVFRVSFPIFKS